MSEHESPNTLPAQTTPTWEVELLISGIAVFAMLQLPSWLDDGMFALEARVSEDWRMILVMAYFYAKSTAIVLAATFALHLLLRAHWIALVGVHSVYPQGVQLDRLRMGPIQRAIEKARDENMSNAIERADNRASVVFAIGVSVALIIALVCLVFCGALAAVKLLTLALGLRVNPIYVMTALFVALMAPYLFAAVIDQAYGHRLDPAGRLLRAVASILGTYTRWGMGRRSNRILAMLSSNGGEKKMMALVFGLMIATIMGVSLAYVGMRTSGSLGNYGWFPADVGKLIESAHYDDERDPSRDRPVPYVQSAVIEGSYLKLVVPYLPRRDEPAMQSQCPDTASAKGNEQAAARLACLQSLYAVTLDGKDVLGLRYEAASDHRTNRPALLAMIDIRDLARGRHELKIKKSPTSPSSLRKDDEAPDFHRIVFWR